MGLPLETTIGRLTGYPHHCKQPPLYRKDAPPLYRVCPYCLIEPIAHRFYRVVSLRNPRCDYAEMERSEERATNRTQKGSLRVLRPAHGPPFCRLLPASTPARGTGY